MNFHFSPESPVVQGTFWTVAGALLTAWIITRPKVMEVQAKFGWKRRIRFDQRLDELAEKVDECSKDRLELREQIKQLQDQVNRTGTTASIDGFIHHLTMPAWLRDIEGRFYCVNRSFEGAFGVSSLSCAGRYHHDLWPQELAAELVKGDNIVLSRGRGVETVELIPQDPFREVSDDNPQLRWLIYRFPVVVNNQLYGLGGIAHLL